MLRVVTAVHVLFRFHCCFLLLLIIHYSFPSYSFSCSIQPFTLLSLSSVMFCVCHVLCMSCFVHVIIRSRILDHSLLCPVPNLLVVVLIRVGFPLERRMVICTGFLEEPICLAPLPPLSALDFPFTVCRKS